MNYYNEHDPYAAQWLRNLIDADQIAPGIVDERSIEDVVPTELSGFVQCHFFAGIGTWSLALRRAGWPDDRPVWTGSCPCQPFSSAGQRKGFADERHLWPAWRHLISQCQPAHVFGEQVASRDGYGWLDLVQTDMEAGGYAFGPVVLPAAGVGAPHGRHRIFFVADTQSERWGGRAADPARETGWNGAESHGATGIMELTNLSEPDSRRAPSGEQPIRDERDGSCRAVAHPTGEQAWIPGCTRKPGSTFWSDADWIPCRDGKFRPVEPGTFPLAHGVSRRMDKLRAYGNSIIVQAAEAVIRAAM